MSENLVDSKEDVKYLNDFISKIKNLRRQFEKANQVYNNKGVISFSASFRDGMIQNVEDLSDLYTDVQNNKVLSRLSKEKVQLFQEENQSFTKAMNDYELNARVAARMGDMFLEMAKNSVEWDTKMDSGYDKNASLMSSEKMLNNMPAVSVNNRV